MKDSYISEFNALLRETLISRGGVNALNTFSAEEISFYETKCGILLPRELKDYLQVFGPGIFGLCAFHVGLLFKKYPEYDIQTSRGMSELAFNFAGSPFSEVEKQILLNCHIFGRGERYGVSLLFDLRTYSTEDQSYDLYGVQDEDTYGKLYYLGRSILDFVRECCLGDRAFRDFPRLVFDMNAIVIVPPEEVDSWSPEDEGIEDCEEDDFIMHAVHPRGVFIPYGGDDDSETEENDSETAEDERWERQWIELKERLPIGFEFTGVVESVHQHGVIVNVGDEIIYDWRHGRMMYGMIDIVKRGAHASSGLSLNRSLWPNVDEKVFCKVIGYLNAIKEVSLSIIDA